MLDTVHILLPQETVPDIELISEIPAKFDVVTKHIKENRLSYSGYTNNLYWSVRESGLYINGSLSKFFFGNNYTNMNHISFKQAIGKLSNLFEIPLMNSRLSQLHFGVTFNCLHDPYRYFKFLGASRYYKSRFINDSTLTYSNKSRSKVFYDKIKELKKNGASLPLELSGTNMIRYEVRYRKGAYHYFNTDALYVHRLFESSFFEQFKQKLLDEFYSIDRIHRSTNETSSVRKASDIKNYIAADALASRGLMHYMDVIEECDNLDSQNKTRARSYCKGIAGFNKDDKKIELYDELASKLELTLKQL